MSEFQFGESVEDYIERRIKEALAEHKVTDIQQLPLAALRRWNENLYQEFENDSPLETRLPLLTALPQAPQDGQVIAYDAGDGITWRFRYNAGSTSSYKWEFVGGPPLRDENNTGTNDATGAYIATNAPSVTCPLAGEYYVGFGGRLYAQNPAGGQCLLGVHVAGVFNSVYIDSWQGSAGTVTTLHATHHSRFFGLGAVTAGQAISIRMRSGSNAYTATSEFRWVQATPIRVG